MLVSHTKKFIYLRSHKVAGTSIELMLEPFCRNDNKEPTHDSDEYISETGIVGRRYYGKMIKGLWDNHTLPETIIENLGENIYNNYFKITSIRNPYDLMVSLYHWRGNDNIDKNSFLDFLKTLEDDFVITNNKIFWGEKNLFIIRYENLHEDLMTLSNTLDLNLDVSKLPHLKKSNRVSYHSYYTEESKKIVDLLFGEEIIKFNYTF